MKKNYLQKILAMALVGTMALGSLAGCGKEDTPASGSNENSSTPESSDQQSTEESGGEDAGTDSVAGVEGYTAFAENVTLSIPVYDRGQEGVPAIGENYWEQWLQENFGDKYNITLKFVPITRTDVLTSYSLLASSKSLPTFLMEYDFPKLTGWVSDGSLTTYDMEQFAFIAPTYYQRMVDLDQIKYTTLNDETYFVLAERPYYNTSYTYVKWVRMDWLEEVGYDHIPATRAEYIDAMTKIQEKGIADHPAGGATSSDMRGIDQSYQFRDYPMNEEEWVMYGDYAIPALGWEPNKKLLRELNENYNLGFTNPEYYVTDVETAKANFINGKTYEYSDYIAANIDWLNSFYATNPDAKLAIAVQATEADTEYGTVPASRSDNPFGMMIGFSSQASEDEIKAAMMYMEWMLQEENLFVMQWGFEGDNFNYGEDGLPASVNYADYEGEHKQGFSNNKDYWCVAIEARSAGTIEDTIKAATPQGLPQDFSAELIQHYYNKVAAAEKGWIISDCMFGTEIKTVEEYQGDLLAMYAEARDDLIMCKPEEFDAKYDEWAEKYANAGYKAIAEERLQAMKDGLTSAMQK